jgi:hypothetical protein
MLQQKIDDALERIRLADLLLEEPEVRALVGLPENRVAEPVSGRTGRHALPVLGG